MDETTVKLVMQWIALILVAVFFVVSAVKWSRGLAIGMFGVLLFNAGAVARNYDVDTFPIALVSLIPVGIGGYLFIKEQKRGRSSTS